MSVATEYIDKTKPDEKLFFERLRAIVYEEAGTVEDVIKYGIPTYLYKGLPVLGFAANKKFLSIYPYGNSTIEPILDELAPFITGSGTLSFSSTNPIPDPLLRKIVQVKKIYIEEKLKK